MCDFFSLSSMSAGEYLALLLNNTHLPLLMLSNAYSHAKTLSTVLSSGCVDT